MLPAISIAYEEAELDIMIRKPRSKHEHLITRKLLTFTYLQMGVFHTFGAFLMYFVIMADFGFPIGSLFGLGLKSGVQYNSGDNYDPYSANFGNSNVGTSCQGSNPSIPGSKMYEPDWIFSHDLATDLRMVFMACDGNGGVVHTINFGQCQYNQISSQTHNPICYTVEALKYAQTGYFISVVVCQWANAINCKTRKTSVYFHGMRNYFQMWGLAAETIFCLALAYIPALNSVLGTRDVMFVHFGMAATPFALFELLYDETRKYLVVNWPKEKGSDKPNWWARNFLW